jgi:hypothetical protein
MTEELRLRKPLPAPWLWPILIGALVGVLMRIAFSGSAGFPFDPMSGAFIRFVPIAVGAVSVYVAEREKRCSLGKCFGIGALANTMFVLGTLLVLIEGLICAIVIVPLFAMVGGVAGLIMGAVCHATNWPKQIVGCVAALPFVLGAFAPGPSPVRTRTIERSVLIAAPREVIWAQLHAIHDIASTEVDGAIAMRIGVPPPESAVTHDHVRRVTMGKHIYFDQVEIERREYEHIRWAQRFYADSFPPNAFDEHVVMGGPHFDIREVGYRLERQGLEHGGLEHGGQATRLTLSLDYRVSTDFNWYADPVARLVLGNLEQVLLDLYASRALTAMEIPGNGLAPRL